MTLPPASPVNKSLVLGTALWGWGVDRTTAYQLLDQFVALGGRVVDTAANYPINKRPEDFGIAKDWIANWITSNGMDLLSVLVKIGATDNMGGAQVDLGRPFILHSERLFRDAFGADLAALAVHWDNRGDSEADAIAETVNTLMELKNTGLSIGFSGVRHPEIYLKAAPMLAGEWWIQVKENVMTDAARLHYWKAFPDAYYLAYGINMGGVKLDRPAENSSVALRSISRPDALVDQLSAFLRSDHGLNPAPADLNELALLNGYCNPALSGIIAGPRTVQQLEKTMHFWKMLKAECTAAMAAKVSAVAKTLN